MATLTLLRHGQASLRAANYDQLSPSGYEQSRRLAHYWTTHRQTFDIVVRGPAERHRQTAESLASAHPELPPATVDERLDEFAVQTLMRKLLPAKVGTDTMRALAEGTLDPETVMPVVAELTRAWATEQVELADVESFRAFTTRVQDACQSLSGHLEQGQRVLAITSAGVIGATIQAALELAPGLAIDLTWTCYNTAWSELAWSAGRWSLLRFNVTAHLDGTELLTLR